MLKIHHLHLQNPHPFIDNAISQALWLDSSARREKILTNLDLPKGVRILDYAGPLQPSNERPPSDPKCRFHKTMKRQLHTGRFEKTRLGVQMELLRAKCRRLCCCKRYHLCAVIGWQISQHGGASLPISCIPTREGCMYGLLNVPHAVTLRERGRMGG